MVAMVGVILAIGAERSVAWLGSVGPLEVGVFVEVDAGLDPLSWIWTGILVGAAMLCCCGEAASSFPPSQDGGQTEQDP